MSLKIQFIHGLEGSPRGAKAVFLTKHFDCVAPAMDTRDFPAAVGIQAQAIEQRPPDILVGSSFGGAVALELLRRGSWAGATVLLAPACRAYMGEARVPAGVRALIVHGLRDDIVPIEESRALARAADPSLVTLLEVDDDHRLQSLVRTGDLADIVRSAVQ